LVRGMLVGLLAGLLVFAFARIFSEPLIERAIAFEDRTHQMAGDPPEPELVSRTIQSTIGLLVGIVAYSCTAGGMFALVFAYAQGRIGRVGARSTAAILAVTAFVVLILVPQIKYPANPPSIGNAETIRSRTALYFAMIICSIIAAVTAVLIGRLLFRRLGAWNATLCGGGLYIAVVALVMLALPPLNEVPNDFPANTLWEFRIASLGGHVVLLATLGLVFGALTEARRSAVRPHFPS
jgi:Probable cobalt transporter subunit (CbtA)